VVIKNEIVAWVWAACGPHLDANGYELVEVEQTNQHGHRVLRIFVDKPGHGITLEDCTKVTHLVNPVLDANETLGDAYMLEVSSPGSDRPLRKPEHFARYAELRVPVRLESLAPVNGRKKFKGTLTGFEDGLIRLECDGQPYEVHVDNLKRANIDR
jgi:ribosome maturation factor RimP